MESRTEYARAIVQGYVYASGNNDDDDVRAYFLRYDDFAIMGELKKEWPYSECSDADIILALAELRADLRVSGILDWRL